MPLPTLNVCVFFQVGEAILIWGTHEEWEGIVYYLRVPQELNHKEGGEQLLNQSRIWVAFLIFVFSYGIHLDGTSFVNNIDMCISLIDQVWLRLIDFCDFLVGFHHFEASVSLSLDFLFRTLRPILRKDDGTVFLAVSRPNYTLSHLIAWIKSCKPLWLLLKW